MEIKTARDLRVALAWHDIPVGQFARAAGLRQNKLSDMLHGRQGIGPVSRERIACAYKRLEAGEIVPARTRLEKLREEQLASGCSASIRQP